MSSFYEIAQSASFHVMDHELKSRQKRIVRWPFGRMIQVRIQLKCSLKCVAHVEIEFLSTMIICADIYEKAHRRYCV